MAIRAYLYDAGGEDHEVPFSRENISHLKANQLLWIDLITSEVDEIRQVAGMLKLPPEATETLLQPIPRPRLEYYERFALLNIDVLQDADAGFGNAELDFVVASNLVLTVHREPIDFLSSFERRVRGDSQLGELNASAFLATLLDWHITSYFRAVEKLEAEVDKLDEAALQPRQEQNLLPKLVRLRQRTAQIRRTLTPHREVYAALVRPDFVMMSGSEDVSHFMTLNARLERAIEATENARELLVGSFEIYATQMAQRTNDTIRILTVVSVALLPGALLTGLMGMNLKARVYELGDAGFWGVLALITVIGVTMVFIARRSRWI